MPVPHPGLFKHAYERDSCGFGVIANLDDTPSHALVRTAMTSLNRLTHRGGKGVITMNVTEKTGKVVGVRQVGSDDQVVLITDHGKIIRLPVKGVRITGRNAQGVHLVKVEEGEKVRAVVPLAEKEEEDDASSNGNGGSEEE